MHYFKRSPQALDSNGSDVTGRAEIPRLNQDAKGKIHHYLRHTARRD